MSTLIPQWRERFMNYIEEQTDGELLMRSITHGKQPLPVISQVSLNETAPNVPLVLKDPKPYTVEEKRIRKIDRLAADAWFSFGEQDSKVLYNMSYETFKLLKGEARLH
ncbi:hypothetical protein Tco_0375662 [Tanacetum coccineum]